MIKKYGRPESSLAWYLDSSGDYSKPPVCEIPPLHPRNLLSESASVSLLRPAGGDFDPMVERIRQARIG